MDYHKKKIRMEILFYDACLLIMKDKGEIFGIAGLYTNNTINVKTETFMKKERKEIIGAKFKAKKQIILEIVISRDFNGYCIIIEVESIILVQKK